MFWIYQTYISIFKANFKYYINMKKTVLPLDEIEVLDGEMLLIRGGISSIMSGAGSGCGCGCAKPDPDPNPDPSPVVDPGKS